MIPKMNRSAKIAAAPTRLMLVQPRPHHAQRNTVTFAARVDASFSKTRLTRMHKIELQAACEELGLSAEGSKPNLVSRIMDQFASEAPAAKEVMANTKVHTVIMNQSAAKPKPDTKAPEVTRATEESAPPAKKSEDLAARVRALDDTIQERTAQLEEFRNTDKRTVEGLLVDHNALKQTFERNLETLSAAMDDVVELQGSYSKLAAVQGEQAELKEMVEALSRLLAQREREVDRLAAQLQEMRSKQAEESKERTSERLAMLALTATQMNSAAAAVGSDAAAATTATAGAATLEPPASKEAVTTLNAAMAMPAAIRANGQAIPADAASDVFGPSLPGLVVCDAGRKALSAYMTVRDIFCHKTQERVAVDVATSAALVATLIVAASS